MGYIWISDSSRHNKGKLIVRVLPCKQSVSQILGLQKGDTLLTTYWVKANDWSGSGRTCGKAVNSWHN